MRVRRGFVAVLTFFLKRSYPPLPPLPALGSLKVLPAAGVKRAELDGLEIREAGRKRPPHSSSTYTHTLLLVK